VPGTVQYAAPKIIVNCHLVCQHNSTFFGLAKVTRSRP